MLPEVNYNELRERLAELEHEQWAHWTNYMLHNMTTENAERWALQVKTPYGDLSESEKNADREWADKSLKVYMGWVKDVFARMGVDLENLPTPLCEKPITKIVIETGDGSKVELDPLTLKIIAEPEVNG